MCATWARRSVVAFFFLMYFMFTMWLANPSVPYFHDPIGRGGGNYLMTKNFVPESGVVFRMIFIAHFLEASSTLKGEDIPSALLDVPGDFLIIYVTSNCDSSESCEEHERRITQAVKLFGNWRSIQVVLSSLSKGAPFTVGVFAQDTIRRYNGIEYDKLDTTVFDWPLLDTASDTKLPSKANQDAHRDHLQPQPHNISSLIPMSVSCSGHVLMLRGIFEEKKAKKTMLLPSRMHCEGLPIGPLVLVLPTLQKINDETTQVDVRAKGYREPDTETLFLDIPLMKEKESWSVPTVVDVCPSCGTAELIFG